MSRVNIEYGSVSLNIKVDTDSAALIRKLADQERRKVANFIRLLIEEGLERRLRTMEDEFPLIEETDRPDDLPTLREWLGAGAPMREVSADLPSGVELPSQVPENSEEER